MHEIAEAIFSESRFPDYTRKQWSNEAGRVLVEMFTVEGMGHGVPVRRTKSQPAAGPDMLDVGLSSPMAMLNIWGITGSRKLG